MILFNKNHRIDIILTYLIYLLPFALITGPFLPDFIISLASILFLLTININGKIEYFKSKYFKFFFILYCYLILSSLLSSFQFSSLENSLTFIRFIIFPLVIWYLIDNNKYFVKNFTLSLLFPFLVAIASGFYQYTYGFSIVGEIHRFERLNLFITDEYLLGNYLSRLFPLLAGLLIINFKNNLRLLFYIISIFILVDVIIYLSGERTALGLMFLSSLFIIIFASKIRLIRIISIILSVGIIILISSLSPSIKERNIDQTIQEMGLNSNSERVYYLTPIHESFIFTSLRMFQDNILIGIGPNNYRQLCGENDYGVNNNSCSTHPHNLYAQTLAETGIIGFIFLLILVFKLGQSLFNHISSKLFKRSKPLTDYQISLLACFMCSLWPFFPSLNLFNNWMGIIFFLPVGFWLHSNTDSTK